MSVRVFAAVTGPNPGEIKNLATEYSDFYWNASEADAIRFMAERPSDAVYVIIRRDIS